MVNSTVDKYVKLTEKIFRELCPIPAPSRKEAQRAKYCLEKIREFGLEGYCDEINNVICIFENPESKENVIFAAHTDIVFPENIPLEITEDEGKIYCPGCGDDTLSVACLLSVIKKIKDEGRKPLVNVIVTLDACEEGLGNADGIKAVMEKFGKETIAFYTFDGKYDAVVNKSVGSCRYEVKVTTEGGHSFGDFGKENAARVLAEGIQQMYKIELPPFEGKTTYNVGEIKGGTTVNSIVGEASMLCEYRSENPEALEYMKRKFQEIFDNMGQYADVEVKIVGSRPCMENVDPDAMTRMTEFCKSVQEKHSRVKATTQSGSTDCNIPHSMGIPGICVGNFDGGNSHSKEEWLYKSSIPVAFAITAEIVEKYFT